MANNWIPIGLTAHFLREILTKNDWNCNMIDKVFWVKSLIFVIIGVPASFRPSNIFLKLKSLSLIISFGLRTILLDFMCCFFLMSWLATADLLHSLILTSVIFFFFESYRCCHINHKRSSKYITDWLLNFDRLIKSFNFNFVVSLVQTFVNKFFHLTLRCSKTSSALRQHNM